MKLSLDPTINNEYRQNVQLAAGKASLKPHLHYKVYLLVEWIYHQTITSQNLANQEYIKLWSSIYMLGGLSSSLQKKFYMMK